jgi:hypothetical protein
MNHGRRAERILGAERLLNTFTVLTIALGNVSAIKTQAALVTTKTGYLWWRLEYAAGLADTTIPTADGLLTHGKVADIDDIDPSKLSYLYLLFTDSAGADDVAGALDYALITRDMG